VVEWLGFAVALGAVYVAWRANHKSDDANEIARRALAISESEHAERLRERNARAELAVSVRTLNREPDAAGVIHLSESDGNLVLAIVISNTGDRDAGRSQVEATLPLTVDDSSLRWSDASGRPLAAHPETAARVGDTNLLARTLDGVARAVPETLYANFPMAVPYGNDVFDYPIRIRVAAEGSEGEAVCDFLLRVGRDLSRP
jgi:hypothetical protein